MSKLSAQITHNNLVTERFMVERSIRGDLARDIAENIAASALLKKTVGDFQTTYTMEIYILTADELHAEARRIAEQFMGCGKPFDYDVSVKP